MYLHVEKWWDSSIVTCGELVGQHYSYMCRSIGKAVQLQVEKCWDSITVTCGKVLGQQHWRTGGVWGVEPPPPAEIPKF
jgi:hypothetical protein